MIYCPAIHRLLPPSQTPRKSLYFPSVSIKYLKFLSANLLNINLHFSRKSGLYRYTFQRQEVSNEYWEGAVEFKYRVEDARLGRFFSVDPLYAKYPWNSNYAFSENSMIAYIELEGLEKIYINSPFLEGEKSFFVKIITEYFVKTSAYKQLSDVIVQKGNIDVYFNFVDYNDNYFNKKGFRTLGTGGNVEPEVTQFDFYDSVNQSAIVGFYNISDVKNSFAKGNRVFVVNISKQYLEEMSKSWHDNDLSLTNADAFVNTLEDVLHVFMHEKHHLIKKILGKKSNQYLDHKEYNCDHKSSSESPPYEECPEDGKSMQSKDKIEIKSLTNGLRLKLNRLVSKSKR